MQSAGTSTSTAHRGCRTVSTERQCRRDRDKFLGTLWNTYAFFVLYANIDNFDPMDYSLDYDKLPVMDKWLLSKMNSMVKAVDENLGNYRIPEAARALAGVCG